MGAFAAGEIVLVDWRGDGLPKEANKLRPCVVVEDADLFDESHPTVVLVPLTKDEWMAVASLSTAIEPSAENGCSDICFAISHNVVSAAKGRVKRRPGTHITPAQLHSIRRQIAETIGLQ